MGGGAVLLWVEQLGHALMQLWEGVAHLMVMRADEASKPSISMIQIAGHSEKIKRKKKKDINIYC